MSNPNPSPMPVGGDPSKPGAWSQDQIDAWNVIQACAAEGHQPFYGANPPPRPHEDTCPGCGAIVRTVNTEPDYETLAEDRAIARDGWGD
jgi:hypothetical protein